MLLTDLLDELRPAWHAVALCRGDGPGHWTLERDAGPRRAEELRRVCRVCPVAVDCLIAGLAEPSHERDNGPMRASMTGAASWKLARQLVAEVDPVTREDWETVTSMVLDEGIIQHMRRLTRAA